MTIILLSLFDLNLTIAASLLIEDNQGLCLYVAVKYFVASFKIQAFTLSPHS